MEQFKLGRPGVAVAETIWPPACPRHTADGHFPDNG